MKTKSAVEWVVGIRTVVLVLGYCGNMTNAQSSPPQDCLIELNVPVYSSIVWQAQLSGTATVEVRIGTEGEVAGVRVEGVHDALKGLIQIQLAESKFRKECAGRSMSYRLTYRLRGLATSRPENALKFRPPNHFLITAGPPIPFTERD